MKKTKNIENFKELPNFNYDFLDLLKEPNLKKLLKSVKEEIILDCGDVSLLKEDKLPLLHMYEYLVNYTSKYCYFIYHFEDAAFYEACAEIKKLFLVFAKHYFEAEDELIESMVQESVNSFRNLRKETKTK
jgi:hypothetical protein